MAKQIISQGIPLVLIVLLGSLIAACNSQPEPTRRTPPQQPTPRPTHSLLGQLLANPPTTPACRTLLRPSTSNSTS